ncbi:hypothetical protein [uncultured Methylovirgula sp.]|uniref:hypothetical protein n=1 Tax=uncultured Methylovirgula sp. TaxID=1285960 RepID=UPI0026082EA8|nr:hypothetical protein [uncultured Methylovirgula sp.]
MDGEVLARCKPLGAHREKTLAVTFIKFIDIFGLARRWMCLELVKCDASMPIDATPESDQPASILIQLESLILAQNERWRQA